MQRIGGTQEQFRRSHAIDLFNPRQGLFRNRQPANPARLGVLFQLRQDFPDVLPASHPFPELSMGGGGEFTAAMQGASQTMEGSGAMQDGFAAVFPPVELEKITDVKVGRAHRASRSSEID